MFVYLCAKKKRVSLVLPPVLISGLAIKADSLIKEHANGCHLLITNLS